RSSTSFKPEPSPGPLAARPAAATAATEISVSSRPGNVTGSLTTPLRQNKVAPCAADFTQDAPGRLPHDALQPHKIRSQAPGAYKLGPNGPPMSRFHENKD